MLNEPLVEVRLIAPLFRCCLHLRSHCFKLILDLSGRDRALAIVENGFVDGCGLLERFEVVISFLISTDPAALLLDAVDHSFLDIVALVGGISDIRSALVDLDENQNLLSSEA